MKRLLTLLNVLLSEIGEQMSTNHDRDFKTIRDRTKDEGLSFLTITLPTFAKGLEQALEQRNASPDLFPAFKRGKGSLPVFLRGLTEKVFDLRTGALLDEASEAAIFCIRQLCCLCKKIRIPCTAPRVADAMRRYRLLDDSIRSSSTYTSDRFAFLFGKLADRLCSELFGDFSVELTVPRHGPGATAQKLSNNQKFSDYGWPARLGRVFPPDWFRFYNLNHWLEDYSRLEEHSPKDELPVRVISVPKTLKTPRIIAIEPVCMQYAQQALSSYMIRKCESDPLVKGLINFTDQKVNASLALSSSLDLKMGTIDLSDASDLVSAKLVWRMLRSVPHFRAAVFACRSTRADVPGIGVFPIAKFASMGSALCFPIESMVFFIIAACAALDSTGTDRLPKNMRSLVGDIRVYGDDIIVPTHLVEVTKHWLEALGLKVNAAKTFYRGNFRESCGVDAYNGHDVTPCYVRSPLPSSLSETAGVVSTVSLANQMFLKGFWKTSDHLKQVVEKITGKLPVVRRPIGGLHFLTFSGFAGHVRWNRHLQHREVKTYVLSQRRKPDAIDGWSALLKVETLRSYEPLHLDVFKSRVAPGAKLKPRWVSAR